MALCSSSRFHALPDLDSSRGTASLMLGACGIRTVRMTPARTRNITASMPNSRVKLAGRLSSTIWPPMRPPMPRPRFCMKNCRAKARVRVPGVEHHTIIVASAGCMTACPAPSARADSRIGTMPVESPSDRAPADAATAAPMTTGTGPRRSMTRPVRGSATRALTAKATNALVAAMEPRPRTCAT